MTDANKALTEIDGFDGYESGYEGDEDSYVGGLLAGTIRLGFDNGTWFKATSKEPMLPGLDLILADNKRAVIRFKGKGKPPEQQELRPGEKWPNLKAKNDLVPKTEWTTDYKGNLVGPWKTQNILFFVDEKTLDKYSWPSMTITIGSSICVEEIVEDPLDAEMARRARPTHRTIVGLFHGDALRRPRRWTPAPALDCATLDSSRWRGWRP